jgi:spore coat protein U-like protein
MKPRSIQLVLIMVFMLVAAGAQAGPCSINSFSPGFAATYVSASPTNMSSTTLDVSCTKTGGNTANPTVAADGGNAPSNGLNQAFFAGNPISYFVSTVSNCSNTWNAANPITFSFTTSGTAQKTFYGCIPTGQNLVPAGTYLDTVNMTVDGVSTASFTVSIKVEPLCAISSAPGTIAFTYTAFGAAQLAYTSFNTTCTRLHSYTMALDSGSGVAGGLNYSLRLNTTQNSGGTISLNPTGIGGAQTFYINGNMAAGQAGCASGTCSGTNPHKLTITY